MASLAQSHKLPTNPTYKKAKKLEISKSRHRGKATDQPITPQKRRYYTLYCSYYRPLLFSAIHLTSSMDMPSKTSNS